MSDFFATPWTVCRLPVSSVHGTFQARILEWVAISCFKGSPNPGIEPRSLASLALVADSLPTESPGKSVNQLYFNFKKMTLRTEFRAAEWMLMPFTETGNWTQCRFESYYEYYILNMLGYDVY